MYRGPCIDVLHERANKGEHGGSEKNTFCLEGSGMLSFGSKVTEKERTSVDEW